MNSAFKYFYNRFSKKQNKWLPFISVYYLTYACDFKCTYCSDGKGNPYHTLNSPTVSSDTAISICRKIREYTSIMTLTGGEPLLHPEFGKIISEIGQLNFKNLLLTTNGYYVDEFLPEIDKSVDTLIFSLDTMDANKAENIYQMPSGTFEKIIQNIEKADMYRKKRYKILISSVVTPSNIDDLYSVYKFTQENGFNFAASPQLVGVHAHEKLWDNEEYRAFFDYLILEKKSNKKIYGTKAYLEYMRDLINFRCAPFTMLVSSPTGGIYYPCLEIGNLIGNINEFKDLHEMKIKGIEKFGLAPNCGNQCHSACSLTFSLLLGKGK